MASLLLASAVPICGLAEDPRADRGPYGQVGWSSFFRGGYVHQSDTDIDDGGSFSVDRLFVQGGAAYGFDKDRSASFALAYGYDGYDFSGDRGFGGLDPWKHVHSFRVSVPVRWGFDEAWTVFAIPSFRITKEEGADTGDAVTAGGFAGFSYRFGDRLTMGPGIGIMTQIEDSSSVFPVLIVNWKITDTLRLTTGRGVGATLGPGLALSWQPRPAWTVSLAGRYERLRFRLNDQGVAPKGIGDDRALPLSAGVTYRFDEKTHVALVAGLEFGGALRLEDEKGNLIAKSDHDRAGFFGLTFNLRF
jgi:hypothetical protein